MRKSSRFWWLHGAILLSAVVGCNRNCTNGGGSCSPGMGGVPPYGGGAASSGGPVGSAGGAMYSQSAPYTGGTAMPSSSSFSTGGSGSYVPNMASQMPQGLGGTR